MTTETEVGRWIAKQMTTAKEHMDRHVSDVTTHAASAMEWSDLAFMAACRHRLFNQVRMALAARSEDEDFMEVFRRLVDLRQKCVMRMARSPTRSTSAVTNFMAQCDMVVHADFVEDASAYGWTI